MVGVAMATVAACGGFSAMCGSSIATAATMAKVSIPIMRQFGYADSLAVGAIAAGGTLGILIPPSVMLVLYGILTETDIGALFIAGIFPGILGVALYSLAVWVSTAKKPQLAPPGERTDWPERWRAVGRTWPVLVLFLGIMGGLYFGIFTPTEAAGVGAMGAFLFVLARGFLNLRALVRCHRARWTYAAVAPPGSCIGRCRCSGRSVPRVCQNHEAHCPNGTLACCRSVSIHQ